MIWEIGSALKHLFLPPVVFGWLLVYALVFFRRKPRRARWALGIGTVLLYASATSWVAGGLMTLAVDAAPARSQRTPQAVVILGGGRALEFDAAGKVKQARLGPAAYERVFEGMRIARQTGLPILVTGGKGDGFDPAEAVVMAEVLRRDLGLAPRWIEAASRNTVENARFSAPLLKREGISSVILVTNGYHMRRARFLFEQSGLQVTPAVADPSSTAPLGWQGQLRALIPNAGAIEVTYLACNEAGGLLYAWLVSTFAAATPSKTVAN